jgi:hypothetical protein
MKRSLASAGLTVMAAAAVAVGIGSSGLVGSTDRPAQRVQLVRHCSPAERARVEMVNRTQAVAIQSLHEQSAGPTSVAVATEAQRLSRRLRKLPPLACA